MLTGLVQIQWWTRWTPTPPNRAASPRRDSRQRFGNLSRYKLAGTTSYNFNSVISFASWIVHFRLRGGPSPIPGFAWANRSMVSDPWNQLLACGGDGGPLLLLGHLSNLPPLGSGIDVASFSLDQSLTSGPGSPLPFRWTFVGWCLVLLSGSQGLWSRSRKCQLC